MYRIQLIVTLILLLVLSLAGVSSHWARKLAIPEGLLIGAILCMGVASLLNIALTYLPASHSLPPRVMQGILIPTRPLYKGTVLIAVNLGGSILPLGYAGGLWLYLGIELVQLGPVIAITCLASYLLSRPLYGFGIALPVLTVPFITAISCKLLMTEHAIAGAFIAGTIGVILGADILRIKNLKQIGSSFVSIGGAGVFDGIVLTGLIASLIMLII